MIIGRDVLAATKIDIRFSDSSIKWDNITIPMHDKSYYTVETMDIQHLQHNMVPPSVRETEDRVLEILDADEELKVVLREHIPSHLSQQHQQLLLQVLRKH